MFEKAVILDHPIFLSAEALKLRQGKLHFFKWNHVFFFDDIITDFKTNLVMLDLANEVAKLQVRLVLSTFRRKSGSLLVLNTEHNGVVHRRVFISELTSDKSRGSLFRASSVGRPKPRLVDPLKVIITICFDSSTILILCVTRITLC